MATNSEQWPRSVRPTSANNANYAHNAAVIVFPEAALGHALDMAWSIVRISMCLGGRVSTIAIAWASFRTTGASLQYLWKSSAAPSRELGFRVTVKPLLCPRIRIPPRARMLENSASIFFPALLHNSGVISDGFVCLPSRRNDANGHGQHREKAYKLK